MLPVRHLSKAPITEALVDIRIAGARPEDQALETLAASLKNIYPHVEPRKQFQATFRSQGGRMVTNAKDKGLQGFFLHSQDRTKVVQIRVDGFTFNKLKPYTTAEELIDEALGVWEQYREAVSPPVVARVALRYLNRLDLPFQPGDDFSRFLTSAPPVADTQGQSVREFLSRVVCNYEEAEALAVVTQRLAPEPKTRTTPVTLDIDVFREGQFGTSVSDLRPMLEILRTLKNRIFFSLVTPEAMELFE